MRIAVVCTDLGVRVGGSKGASLHLEAVVRGLAHAGHEVLLIGVGGSAGETVASWPGGVTCLLFPHPGRSEGREREARKLAFVEHVASEAAAPLRAFAPDVVYERLSLFGDAGARLARQCGARHVVEVNALLAEEEGQWRGLHAETEAANRERRVLAGADLVIAVSEPTAAAVRRVAPGSATRVLPNGVDARRFAVPVERAQARQSWGMGDAPLLGFAGSLRPWHGLDAAVDALPELPGVVLAVAGEGPVRAQLTERAHRLGVDEQLRWLGHLPHERMPVFLAALDVALLPYPDLPDLAYSPLKLYEYAAAGVPVVASDIGPGADVVRDLRSGLLVQPGSAPALAAGVRDLLADLPRWRAAAQAARTRALAEHSWDSRITELAGWLRQLCGDADGHAA